MKLILLLLALILLFSTHINAQGFSKRFRDRLPTKPPSASKVIGCIAIPVGAISATFGGIIYGADAPIKSYQKPNYPALDIALGGGVLVIGGIVLLITDAHHHKNRLSLVAPKNNEVGLAYNF